MDNTPIYILMSDCPEIQGEIDIKIPCVTLRHERWEGSKTFEAVLVDSRGNVFFETGIYLHKTRKSTSQVWLPRQDDLQKMLKKTQWLLIADFWAFCNDGRTHDTVELAKDRMHIHIYKSMEQLWLAFVMSELHSKTWSNEAWVSA